ncbi:hypothetical protein ACIBXA_06035 [Micromonospora echinaurantiaca]|uniref:Uncharacterized protein n=1 Tax=Micromonospora echinaurantiaca TaxID=47857 RepID=A0A1C5JPY6_9ACTN|nr:MULTISPECIES: hypothetical protein [Micromonospora]PWU52881.1 hypothetical protein DLJ47_17730 [Micromonospora sp. S4605]SCG72401.1 hypothetical protein GA0070609_4700 [Micromonospora echinaurantiaca]
MSSSRARRGPAQPDSGDDDATRADAQVTTCATVGLPITARVLFAVVTADGNLVRGLGAAQATRLARGKYQVIFDQDVTAAGYVGTIGLPGSAGVAPPGQVAVAGRTGIPNGVFVSTFAGDGSVADRPFHLTVLS